MFLMQDDCSQNTDDVDVEVHRSGGKGKKETVYDSSNIGIYPACEQKG